MSKRTMRESQTVGRVAAVLVGLLALLSFVRPSAPVPDVIPEIELFADAPPVVRVRVDALGRGPWRVRAAEGLIVEVGGRSARTDEVQVRADGTELSIDGKPVELPVSFSAVDGGDLTIDSSRYPGALGFARSKTRLRPVLRVPLETYLANVLPSEMPLSYPVAALRSQVVIARTYAVWSILRSRQRGWDVRDGEASQVFKASSGATARGAKLVADVAGWIVTWEEKPLPTYYSSTCGGATRSNADAFNATPLAPLAGRSCEYCKWSSDFAWTTTLELADVERRLGLRGVEEADVVHVGAAGYGAVVMFRESSGTKNDVPASRLRRHYGSRRVKSTKVVSADVEGRRLVLEGRGFGHGVGLCQNGARGLAELGRTPRKILDFYYPGARLARLKSIPKPTSTR